MMRSRGFTARSVATLVTLVTTACATGTGPANSHFFLERSYVGPVRNDDTLLYEGQAAAHIFLSDNLSDAFARLSQDTTSSWFGASRFIVTPMFRIRQLNDSSSAVRTPSFMPRLSAEYLVASRLDRPTGPVGNLKFSHVLVSGARITLAHHSNGQAGCFREGFDPVDRHANECTARQGYDTSIVKLNRANGDFSTTFVQLMVHTTWMNRATGGRETHSLGVAGAFDYHLPGIFGALSDEQRQLYGSWRARGLVEGEQVVGSNCDDGAPRAWYWSAACGFRGRARISADYERAPENPGPLALRIKPSVLPWRGQFELSYAFSALLGAGAFVRWHDGQDYYNINFVNRRRVFMYGLMLDASAIPRIGPAVVH